MTDKHHIDPETLNEMELMKYYNLRGKIGKMRLGLRLGRSWILQALASICPFPEWAAMFQRARGVKIGQHVYLGPSVFIDLLYPQLVTIKDYVSIGMNSMIFAHSNPTYSMTIKEKFYPRKVAPVNIDQGVWIAPNCMILAGVTVGMNAVVGAGSLVAKDVPPWTVVAGVPACVIRRLEIT